MKEQFCNYEIALKLKELGFDGECLAIYTHNNEMYEVGSFFLNHPHPYTIEELSPIVQDIRKSTVYILAPLWQQVIDWLRVTHKICVIQDLHPDMSCSYDPSEQYFQFNLVRINNNGTKNALHPMDRGRDFNSYQDGREWMILKAIELCQ